MLLVVSAALAIISSNQFAAAETCPPSPYTLTNGTTADASQVMENFNSLRNCINSQPGLVFPPTGRLTLTSGVPVLGAPVSSAGVVYYTPYTGNLVPLWTGSGFVGVAFSELSNVLANSASGNAGPAAVVAGSVYDLFVWLNGSVPTLTRGPAWASATSRQLTLSRVSGTLTNTAAIANGPAAGFGTYVGTVSTDASSATVSFVPSVIGASGGTSAIGLWNAFNRRQVVATVTNANASWTVLASTPREVQGGPFRVRFVAGLSEDVAIATYGGLANSASSAFAVGYVGVALDNVTNFDQSAMFMNSSSAGGIWYRVYSNTQYSMPIGSHYIAALEASDGSNSQTFFGSSASNNKLSVVILY